jgi:hypothetical protein
MKQIPGRHRVMALLNLAPEEPPIPPPPQVTKLFPLQFAGTARSSSATTLQQQFQAIPEILEFVTSVTYPSNTKSDAQVVQNLTFGGLVKREFQPRPFDIPASAAALNAASSPAVEIAHGNPACQSLTVTIPAETGPELAGKVHWFPVHAQDGGQKICAQELASQITLNEKPSWQLECASSDATEACTPNQTFRMFRVAFIDDIPFREPEGKTAVRKDSVGPSQVLSPPAFPIWQSEARKFDWALLIARLADFESSKQQMMRAAEEHYRTQQFAVAERQKKIPVLGPILAMWQAQTWPVRAALMVIPLLAAVAIKPSFDGSLSEPPIVLAKEVPPASSTALRRMPAKEQAEQREAQKTATDPKTVARRNAVKADRAGDLPVAVVDPKLNNVDRMLLSRAAVELVDDFSFGLDSWDYRDGTAWTYDRTGFIRPKALALFRPSMSLTDYSFEFLAKIDVAAIAWVVRAVDANNYHAVKLVQRGNGPLPRYTIVRYSVVNGQEGPRIEHPLPLNLYKDTLFRIRMDIRGSNYALVVQDSIVDSWSDDRFQFGGLGFFSGRGEESRIRWVQVTYQNDLLGKICAWLAPKTS